MRRLRLIAVGLLTMAASMSTFAQSADTTAATPPDDQKKKADENVVRLEEFKVNGSFGGSLAAAAQAKENNTNISEVVMSEDIGKLPDVSIADSLTRLPGITTQRTNGRSQAIYLRGMTPDFSVTTMNGREQVSTGENRGVEFDQYPAELLNSVVVYKTASADLPGQGLAGTIDMQTVRPLDRTGRTIAVNAYYSWTQLGQLTPGVKKDGERFTISYIDQFDDGKLGIALGYSHMSSPWEGQQFQAWGYPTDGAGNFALGGTKSYVRTTDLDRDSFMGVIEYKPNSMVHSTFDFFKSKFKETDLLRGMEIPMAFWSSAVLQPGYTVSNGLITDMTLTNIMPVDRNDVFKRTDDLLTAGWNLKLGDGTGWTTVFDVGYSKINRNDEDLETYSGLSFRGVPYTTADTMTVKLMPGQIPVITPTVNYADPTRFRLTDPQGWGSSTLPSGGMEGYLKYFRAKDEMAQFKLETEHELPKFFKAVKFGVTYTDHYKRDGEGPSGFIVNSNNANSAALPPIIGTTDLSFLGLGGIYAYDPLAAQAAGVWDFVPNTDTGIVANRWQVYEKITRPYVKFAIDTKVGGIPLQGDVGFQGIHADQSSKGFSANGNTLNAVDDGAQYWDFAPSLNLNLKPTSEDVIRFSLARQVARPRLYDLRASRTYSYNAANAAIADFQDGPWSGNGGNARLRPWLADSVDLSYEHYFKDNKGYVALAAFHKKLLSFIYTQNILQDFTDYPIPAGDPTPVLHQGIASAPANGQGGSIEGAELTISLPSELLSPSIKGFGVVLNGAYTDSSIEPWGPGQGTAPIAGLARKVASATVYYERHGFSIRVSERYRSETREYITTFGVPNPGGDVSPGNGFSTAQPERIVDAQMSYEFQSGWGKGITIILQAYNLNNEPLITYNNGDPRQVINYQKYGASYSTGISYKF